MILGLGNAILIVCTWVEEVELVEYDQAGLFLLKDELGDLAILGGDAGRQIDDKDAEI